MSSTEALTWRKSSYSEGGQTNCVEVAWRKSSYSQGGQTDCVEIAFTPESVAVRDSKNATGPVLDFPPASWRAFLAKAGGGRQPA
ncbi:DUF397 domain-containing protein [Goodfellowiella coeruleoviolacea]|uniref:DUF397 domain-containing protein n=1 Tax=Goodfellowiella coeruleoviolacea TaxID=334858 RepID=UPI0020A25B5D|nr:DUF397 domain-containing protein [Goodfellowiella coeruleoviolacea]